MLSAYRADIDGLRAVAILSVVIFHVNPSFLPGGFTGVDIFFVISGFLITRIILDESDTGQFSFAGFWIRRAKRILPALFFMLSIITALSFVVLMPADLYEYGGLLAHSVFFAANMFLSSEAGYFAPEGLNTPLLHVWSLSVEEQYYLIWPIVIILAVRNMERRHIVFLALLLGAMSLAYSEWATINDPKLGFYSLPSRAFELLIGAIVAIVNFRRLTGSVLANVLGVAGLLLICAGLLFIDETSRFPGLLALLPCLGAALLLISGTATKLPLINRLLSTSGPVRVGKISYSWYLWHWPPLALARYYFERPLSVYELAILLLAGLSLAVVSYRYIESPFRRPSSPLQFRRNFLPTAIACSAVLISCGFAFQIFKGVPIRLGTETLALFRKFERSEFIGCDDSLKKAGRLGECEFGAATDREPTLFLWGDSHAEHYLPAIAKLAASDGIRGILRSTGDCRPFVTPEKIDRTARKRRRCGDKNDETLAMILARPDISVVILAGRWSKRREIEAPPSERLGIFRHNVEKTIATLQQAGKRVVLLGQVPERPVSLKDCMTKQLRFGLQIRGCESSRLADHDAYETGIWAIMQRIARENGQVAVFSPEKHMCDAEMCRATDERGEPLYSDGQHLLPGGAYFLEPHISAAIGKFVRGIDPQVTASTAADQTATGTNR